MIYLFSSLLYLLLLLLLLQPLAKELGIKVVPTFKILKGGKVVKEVTGAKIDELAQAIDTVKSDWQRKQVMQLASVDDEWMSPRPAFCGTARLLDTYVRTHQQLMMDDGNGKYTVNDSYMHAWTAMLASSPL